MEFKRGFVSKEKWVVTDFFHLRFSQSPRLHSSSIIVAYSFQYFQIYSETFVSQSVGNLSSSSGTRFLA